MTAGLNTTMNKTIREIRKHAKSTEEADFLPTLFGDFHRDIVSGRRPVVLFGAGSAGEHLCPLLELHGVKPICFCDNNPARVGARCCGLPIISAKQLQSGFEESLILVASAGYKDEIRDQLLALGIDGTRVLTVADNEALNFYTHLYQWHWSEEDLVANADVLLAVYRTLADQKSREIFTRRIALFVGGADYRSFRAFLSRLSDVDCAGRKSFSADPGGEEAYLQFNNDLVRLADGEFLVDAGAYTGDSVTEFVKACAAGKVRYRGIACFEPDPEIFARLAANTAGIRDLALERLGLWSASGTVAFAGADLRQPGCTMIISANSIGGEPPPEGTIEIRTARLDDHFRDQRVTIIKMDIEGAEIEALKGARQTIARCRPKLIVSAYHKRDDLFEIPLLLDNIAPDYKLFLRHFSCNFGETTLIAIP